MDNPNSPTPSGLGPVLAERLLEMIVRNGHAVGERLKEQSLADALGVSRTPVRKALQYLEERGVVGSNPNRGFFVAKDPAQLRKVKLPTDAESDEAIYMRVVEDRLAGTLGEEIAESALMERYALTRLQVQRVLNRMARENLIDRKPGRGWIFRPVLDTAGSHRESYRFRMIIEPAAILEPTFRVDRALFDKVRREQMQLIDGGIERWTPAERFRGGADFHEAIVQCSNNRFLIDAMRNVNQLRRVIEYHSQTGSTKDQARMRRQCEEHLVLLDLLEAGERMEASHMLRQHLDVVRAIKTNEAVAASASRAASPAASATSAMELHL
jgi:DNA-binding GntR family transcriptional regulator